jgi:hypothetical protein
VLEKVSLNKEYKFTYLGAFDDDVYVLAKNEFFLQNKTFIFMGQMKFKYKIPKLIPISYSSNRHFFLFKPKLLGNYLLEVYKNGIHIDTLNIEVV